MYWIPDDGEKCCQCVIHLVDKQQIKALILFKFNVIALYASLSMMASIPNALLYKMGDS